MSVSRALDAAETSVPFGRHSISLGLYREELPADQAAAAFAVQASSAEEHGFDGVTVSEHHGGLAGYFPDPVLTVTWMLSATTRAWGAASPILLPLRSTNLVIESVVWTAARFPNRFGVAFAPGWAREDFEIAGASYDDRRPRYWEALRHTTRALRGEALDSPLANDPAVALCAHRPVPTLSAAAGPVGVARAADADAGILLADFHPTERLRELVDAYVDAGGDGPRVACRRVWIGDPPRTAMERLVRSYRAIEGDATFLKGADSSTIITSPSADDLASRLAGTMADGRLTALNLRVHLPDVSAEQHLDQIRRIGGEVLPRLRDLIAAGTRA